MILKLLSEMLHPDAIHRCRSQGGWGQYPLQFWADQLPCRQRGVDYAHHITMCPPSRIFKPSYVPASAYRVNGAHEHSVFTIYLHSAHICTYS